MQAKIDLLSELLRDLEAEIGTRDVATTMFFALVDSLKAFKVKDAREFCDQFQTLAEVVSSTEPKFGILNYNFAKLSNLFREKFCKGDFSEKKWKQVAIKNIEEILDESRGNKANLMSNAEKLDVEGKTILIHDHSHTVQDVLVHYKNMGKHFRVVIAEQDFDKTHSNIERMYDAQIPFQVVPSYMLSHVHRQIDMLFFGALTLKDTMHFVMDPGTHGIISEFNIEHKPVYMFIDTAKFSLWKSKKRGEIFIHKHMRTHLLRDIEYERIKYSHDRVPANLFHKIITNEGLFTPTQLKTLFMKKMKEYNK